MFRCIRGRWCRLSRKTRTVLTRRKAVRRQTAVEAPAMKVATVDRLATYRHRRRQRHSLDQPTGLFTIIICINSHSCSRRLLRPRPRRRRRLTHCLLGRCCGPLGSRQHQALAARFTSIRRRQEALSGSRVSTRHRRKTPTSWK